MTRRTRLALALTGLILVLVSVTILATLAWPAGSLSEQAPLIPTLFAPPP